MKVFIDTNILIDFLAARQPVEAKADYIVTRNKKDFDFGDNAVVTPREFFNEQNIEFE